MVVGLVAPPGLTQALAEQVARRLPSMMRKKFPDVSWKVVLSVEPLAGAVGMNVDLIQLTRRRMLEEGWQLAICLTDLPLKVGRHPVTAHLSATLGVGVVSVPSLGAIAVEERVLMLVARTLEALLSGGPTETGGAQDNRLRARMRARLHQLRQLSSPMGLAYPQEQGTVRFATATARGNLRLLGGLIRNNRPWPMIVGLSRTLVAAVGVSALGLTSPAIWRIADAMSWQRLTLLSTGSLGAMVVTLMAAHSLWERFQDPDARKQVVVVNMATSSTVLLGVLSLYVVLLILNAAVATAIIPSSVLTVELHHPSRPMNYVHITWLLGSLATLGGALGSAIESNIAVREAAFRIRATERRGEDRVGG